MDLFVARQAIFNRRLGVFGYELLYRSTENNCFDGTDGAVATSRVIANTISIGFGSLIQNKRGFVNFPRELLLDESAHVLPPAATVVEILEDVQPDPEVLEACRLLKQRGYLIALDDVASTRPNPALAGYADILKVDLTLTAEQDQDEIARQWGQKFQLLAEKVETYEQFERARRAGYSLFQGYFFARPAIISRWEIPGYKLVYLQLLRAIRQPDLDFGAIEKLMLPELSLTYKLLRYINSPLFGYRVEIHSIGHALVLLGETELRRWISIVVLPRLASDKPDELVVQSMLRARFCELLAPSVGLANRRQDLFVLGMFSLLDVMIGRPMEELLDGLHLSADICGALLRHAPPGDAFAGVLETVECYEQAAWHRLRQTMARLRLADDVIREAYLEAGHWSTDILSAAKEEAAA